MAALATAKAAQQKATIRKAKTKAVDYSRFGFLGNRGIQVSWERRWRRAWCDRIELRPGHAEILQSTRDMIEARRESVDHHDPEDCDGEQAGDAGNRVVDSGGGPGAVLIDSTHHDGG